ncbi:hypothetical protein [Methylobacterium sp. CM6244]
MGFNTVAVLYNDFTHELEKDGRYGKRIAEAMQAHGLLNRGYDHRLNFGAGAVISQAHADNSQVVIVARNSGVRAQDANDLDWHALAQMSECLERHGYKVKKPSRKKPTPPTGGL